MGDITYSFLFLKFIKIVDYLLICYLLIYFVYVYTHRHTYHDMVVRVQLLDSVLSYLVGLRNQTEVVRLEAITISVEPYGGPFHSFLFNNF